MGIISELLRNPIDTIIFFLLAMPGRLLAISAHEAAHGWVAWKCGDPTAKYMDLILFCLGCVLMYAVVGVALAKAAGNTFRDAYYIAQVAGESALVVNGSYIPMSDLMIYAPYLSDFLVGGIFGEVASYVYQMLMYFTLTNLVLAIFNLIPIPPLDGYHVLNDMVLSRFRNTRLFVSPRASQIFTIVLFLLIISGVTGEFIGWVQGVVLQGVGSLAGALFAAIGLI